MFVLRALGVAAIAALALGVVSATAADTVSAPSQCVKAKRKVAKEEKWTTAGEATLERNRKARDVCTTRAVCERYDARLHALEMRKARHDSLLAKSRSEAASACGAG
jgi:hypothetical protein